MPVPTKQQMRDFCTIDEWDETPRTDHYRYKKLVGGDILRTKVSLGRGPAFNDPGLWHRVWKHQLALRSEDEFWDALKRRAPVDRAQPGPAVAPPSQPTKPAWLVQFLVHVDGLPLGEVLAMTEGDALRRYEERVSEGG